MPIIVVYDFILDMNWLVLVGNNTVNNLSIRRVTCVDESAVT